MAEPYLPNSDKKFEVDDLPVMNLYVTPDSNQLPRGEYTGLNFTDEKESEPLEEEVQEFLPNSDKKFEIKDTSIVEPSKTLPNSDTLFQVEGSIPFGENNEALINLPSYIASRQRDPKFLTGGIFGEAGTSGDISELYYTRDLTKEDILGDPVFMEIARSSLESRYSPTVISKSAGLVSAAMGADSGGIFNLRNYRDMPDEEVFEIYQNWMRLFNSANSITVANEVNAGFFASEEERAKIGAGYTLFGKMDNAFTGRGSWSEMGDALFDYTRSAVYDPTTLLSFGIAKLLYTPVAKAQAEGLKKLMMGYYKTQLSKGVTKEQARKKVASAVSKREVALATASFAVPDLFFNLGLDVLQQTQLINVDNQKEVDKNRVAITGLTSMFVPALFGTSTYLARELRKSNFLKDTVFGYVDVDQKLRQGSKNIQSIIDERVEPNIPQMIERIDEHFGNIKGNPSKLTAWETAKKEADLELARNPIDDRTLQDLDHTQQFFREFFLDTVDAKGEVITKGYISALRDAGFVFHEDLIKEKKISGILGQTIKYLPDNVVKRIMKSYEDRTGKVLNLEYTADSLAARYINIASAAGRYQNIASLAVQAIMKRVKNTQEAISIAAGQGKIDLDKSPKLGQYTLSIYKRLLTSHPSTTGSNLQGFSALTFLDTAAEYASSVIHLAQYPFYKVLARNPERAMYHANQAYGNFFGATRRGLSVLSPDMEVGYANKILDLNNKEKSRIFRDIAGDGGVNDSLAMFNLDKTKGLGGAAIKSIDFVTKGAQTISLVRLQDEYTKLWAFGNNMNKFIMSEYGVSPSQFFNRTDIGAEIITPRFQKNVLEKATFQTLRQTASVNWSQLVKMHGNNFFRRMARGYEFFTNKTPGGFLVPFGSFNNTVIANFGDFTGINFLRFAVQRARGRQLDPESQDMTESISKMAVGYTYVTYRLFGGVDEDSQRNSALKKVQEGRAFNENLTKEGAMADRQYDWPLNQFDLTAQILAHGLTGEGRDVLKDLEGISYGDAAKYIQKNFNRKNIPPELLEKLALSIGFSAVRDVDRVFTYVNKDFLSFFKGERDDINNIEFLGELLATAASRIFQGATRPAEPLNMVANLFRFEGKVPDLKQGNQIVNNSTKYINSLLPDELPFGAKSPMSLERQATILSGKDIQPDYSKMMFGARRSPEPSLGRLMLNSAGLSEWQFVNWGGDPKIKNTMDALAAPIFEEIAINTLEKYPNFFKANLKEKKKVISDMGKELRERTEKRLDSLTPKTFSMMRKLLKKGNKDKLNTAIGSLVDSKIVKEGSTVSDILELDNAVEIIQQLNFLVDNHDSIFLDFNQMR